MKKTSMCTLVCISDFQTWIVLDICILCSFVIKKHIRNFFITFGHLSSLIRKNAHHNFLTVD